MVLISRMQQIVIKSVNYYPLDVSQLPKLHTKMRPKRGHSDPTKVSHTTRQFRRNLTAHMHYEVKHTVILYMRKCTGKRNSNYAGSWVTRGTFILKGDGIKNQ